MSTLSLEINHRVDPVVEVDTAEAAVQVVATGARGEDNTRHQEAISKILVSTSFYSSIPEKINIFIFEFSLLNKELRFCLCDFCHDTQK